MSFRRPGFSLLEMTMVLLILSIVAAAFVGAPDFGSHGYENQSHPAAPPAIQDALVEFRRVSHRLPCPADGTLTIGSHNLGLEYGSPNNCTDGLPAGDLFSARGIVMGTVPTKSLGLADEVMYDAWGGKISYAVDPSTTATCAFANAPLNNFSDATVRLTVNDETGGARTDQRGVRAGQPRSGGAWRIPA